MQLATSRTATRNVADGNPRSNARRDALRRGVDCGLPWLSCLLLQDSRSASGALDRDAVQERLRCEIELQERSGVQYWPMLLAETGELVGCAGLRPREVEERVYELGFHLCASAWGQGLATEAAMAVVVFAFGDLGASALFAGHNPQNAASARVLGKLGFRHTHDEHYAPTGLLHPSYLLTREDWGRQPRG